MKFFKKMKDGGTESKVVGYFLFEIKPLASVVLLKFENGSREAYHNHAFNAVSWLLKGKLLERLKDGREVRHSPSLIPIFTSRSRYHMVLGTGTSWVLSFRGPWASTWKEYLPKTKKFLTLTHGRKVLNEDNRDNSV